VLYIKIKSGEGEKGRCLPWRKEKEGAYIFWMKQVSVHWNPEPVCNSEHRKMRAKQQHVCKEMNQYILYIRSIPTGNGFQVSGDDFFLGPRYIGDDFLLGPIIL
jgi:hypothetical protein